MSWKIMAIPEYYLIDHEDHKHVFMIVPYGYCILLSQILKINLDNENDCISIISYDKTLSNIDSLKLLIDQNYKKFPKILVKSTYCDPYDTKHFIINDRGSVLLLILTSMGNKISLRTILDYKMHDLALDFVSIYGYNSNMDSLNQVISKIDNCDNLPKIALKR